MSDHNNSRHRLNQDDHLKNSRQKKQNLMTLLLVLAIILVAVVPTVHYFIANEPTKAKTVKVSKARSNKESSSSKKSATSAKDKATSTKSSVQSESSSVESSSATTAESSSSSEATTYVVQAGDSLMGIAQKSGITIDQLLSLNNLTIDATISTGMSLRIK